MINFYIYSKNYNLAIGSHVRKYRRLEYIFKKYNMNLKDSFAILDALTDVHADGITKGSKL